MASGAPLYADSNLADLLNSNAAHAALHTVTPSATATGTGQSDAYLISHHCTVFTSVPSGTGTVLPSLIGFEVKIVNRGANPINVYPPTGAQIESSGTNQPVIVVAGGVASFALVAAGQVYGF